MEVILSDRRDTGARLSENHNNGRCWVDHTSTKRASVGANNLFLAQEVNLLVI